MIISPNPIAAAWPDSNTFWRDKRVVVTGGSSPHEETEALEMGHQGQPGQRRGWGGGDTGGVGGARSHFMVKRTQPSGHQPGRIEHETENYA